MSARDAAGNTVTPWRLACEFASELRATLTAKQMSEIIKRNRRNEPHVCASHDFCDANMVMASAFERLAGREPQVDRQKDADLWNRAWGLAKAREFRI